MFDFVTDYVSDLVDGAKDLAGKVWTFERGLFGFGVGTAVLATMLFASMGADWNGAVKAGDAAANVVGGQLGDDLYDLVTFQKQPLKPERGKPPCAVLIGMLPHDSCDNTVFYDAKTGEQHLQHDPSPTRGMANSLGPR
ncbi:MAG: hypothetical protein ACAI25_03655 [Planctomycetota bacterium]